MKKLILITILCCCVNWPVQAQETELISGVEDSVWTFMFYGDYCRKHPGTIGFHDGRIYGLYCRDYLDCCFKPCSDENYLWAGQHIAVFRIDDCWYCLEANNDSLVGMISTRMRRGIMYGIPPVCTCMPGNCDFFFPLRVSTNDLWSLPEDICQDTE